LVTYHESTVDVRRVKLILPDTLAIDPLLSVQIDGQGNILMRLIPQFLIGVFDSTGHFSRTIGTQGFGNGQIRSIRDFRISDCGEIVIMDAVTNDIQRYVLNRGWISTSIPHVRNPMAFDLLGEELIFLQATHLASEEYHIQIDYLENVRGSIRPRMLLKGSDESVRTEFLLSQSLATEGDSLAIWAFMSAKTIYTLSSEYEVGEIELESPFFSPSKTEILLSKYQTKDPREFLDEVFCHSRVLSLGYISKDIILVTFVSGRFENAKFFAQRYSLSHKAPIDAGFEIDRPIYYAGHHKFALFIPTRFNPPSKKQGTNEVGELSVITFKGR
jgi:hypothetical protein